MSDDEQQILKLLNDHSSDESWANRQLGAQLAGQHKILSLERLVTRLLKDRSEWVRYHAFQALVQMEIPSARLLPIAKSLMKDPFFRLRQSVSNYLEDTLHGLLSRGARDEQSEGAEVSFNPGPRNERAK